MLQSEHGVEKGDVSRAIQRMWMSVRERFIVGGKLVRLSLFEYSECRRWFHYFFSFQRSTRNARDKSNNVSSNIFYKAIAFCFKGLKRFRA